MNNPDSKIEAKLRHPQRFDPPARLKDRLVEQIPVLSKEDLSRQSRVQPALRGGWFKRWWPALLPGAISAACAVVMTAQQGTIRELTGSIQSSSQSAAAPEANAAETNNGTDSASMSPALEYQAEIDRLKELEAKLTKEIGQLQQFQTENEKLRSQLATGQDNTQIAQDAEASARAKERAQSIACINNLKQFGLAVRIWALDNNDSNPPNVVCMSNELSTPKILVCPADTGHQLAADFFSFTMANCSYEFLAPSEVTDKEPQRILSRCPIHGHIGLCDGSVQSKVGKDHPDWLIQRDGKLYFSPPNLPNAQNARPSPQPNAAAPVSSPNRPNNLGEEQIKALQERYGLAPSNGATPP